MNLFLDYKKSFIVHFKELSKKDLIECPNDLNILTVENPPRDIDADLSLNAALTLAKFNKKNPMDLAINLKEFFLKKFNEFETIEVVKPGFINFKFKKNFWSNYIFKFVKIFYIFFI